MTLRTCSHPMIMSMKKKKEGETQFNFAFIRSSPFFCQVFKGKSLKAK